MIIYVLSFGPLRTGQLQRSMPGISKKMLSQTLRTLERDGLIQRLVFPVVPPKVEYSLTPLGSAFVEPLLRLYEWADEHSEYFDQLDRHHSIDGQVEDPDDRSNPLGDSTD